MDRFYVWKPNVRRNFWCVCDRDHESQFKHEPHQVVMGTSKVRGANQLAKLLNLAATVSHSPHSLRRLEEVVRDQRERLHRMEPTAYEAA